MRICEITLMGAFGVQVEGRPVPNEEWRLRRPSELVKVLALAEGHRLHREQLMDTLWPDLNPDAAAANLRKAVHFVRKALGSELAIVIERETISLYPSAEVGVDLDRFEEAARRALRSKDAEECMQAASLYKGEVLLEDRYALWAEQPRERARMQLTELLKTAGAWEELLEVDPTEEEAYRALMQRAIDAGDRSAAIRQFERLRDRLRADLGIGPDKASVTVYEQALALEGAEPPTPAARARALVAWALVLMNSGDLESATRKATEARQLAVDAGLGGEFGEASAVLGMVATRQGRWKEVFRSEFIDSVRRSPRLASFVFDAHLCLAEYSLTGPLGHEDIAGYAKELLAVAEDAGSVQGRGLAELLLGEVELFSDHLSAAEAHLNAADKLHQEADAASGRALSIQRLAETAIAQGEHARATRLLEEGFSLAGESSLAPHLLVRMHGVAVEGARDHAQALDAVTRADDALGGNEICRPCSMGFRIGATVALARGGELHGARRRLEEADGLAGMWSGGPWHAAVWEARAELRRAEGNEDQAVALFKEAADLFAKVGRARDEVRCRTAAKSDRRGAN
jgi:DNA-binding SARP family transcriptional activator